MSEELQTDVTEAPSPSLDTSSEVVSAPADVQGESVPTEGQTPTTDDKAGQAEAAFQVPENDDDLKGKENDPHVQAIIQMRGELRARDQLLDGYKPLESWKTIAETIGDPLQAQTAYELVSSIHTPSTENPSGFTARPFLEKLETESPGSVDQVFADILTFQIPDAQGNPSTVVRELYRSHGLDPDRVDDYRNIDTLRASGVVTAEDISKIPEKYHPAFKSLSQAAREDILSMQETNPAAMEEYLRNANDALEARSWREKDEAARKEAAEQQEVQFKQEVAQAVETDIFTEVRSIHDSIHQNLASQWKPSSDETLNNLEYGKVMSVLSTLQFPQYRFVAENALKAVGVTIDPKLDEWANRWEERRSAYTTFTKMNDKLQANRALSDATHAKQQVMLRLNDYALKLAKGSGQRLQAEQAQQGSQLAAATARFVPNGNGQGQQGDVNPYMQNPHPVGSQEWNAYYRDLDRQFKLNGASMLGGN